MIQKTSEVSEQGILKAAQSSLRLEPAKAYVEPGVHILVLVHGFQGNHIDMRLFRNQIILEYPEVVILNSSANEERTEGDIDEMG